MWRDIQVDKPDITIKTRKINQIIFQAEFFKLLTPTLCFSEFVDHLYDYRPSWTPLHSTQKVIF